MRASTMAGAILVAATLLLVVAVRDGHCAQLCMDSTFPRATNASLSFCGYNGTSCCNATDDAAVQKQFAAMNISGTPCGDVVKNVLCARCSPYAGELFTVTTAPRTVPLLCSTTGASSRLSSAAKPAAAAATATTDYCTQVWDTCKDVRVPGSPFQAPRGTAPSPAPRLTDPRHVPGARRQRLLPQHGGAPGRVRPRVPQHPGRQGLPGRRAAAGLRAGTADGRGQPVPRHHRRGAHGQRVRPHGPRLPPGFRCQRPLLRLLQLRQDAAGHVRRPLRLQLRRRLRPVQARRRQRQAAVPVPQRRRRVQRQLHLRNAGDGDLGEPGGGEEDHHAGAAVHDAPRRADPLQPGRRLHVLRHGRRRQRRRPLELRAEQEVAARQDPPGRRQHHAEWQHHGWLGQLRHPQGQPRLR
uniref:Uncharacterized protein n=1 Tax=Zea mays TaxID=4577 RepID=A0A804Q6J7_MAIZE